MPSQPPPTSRRSRGSNRGASPAAVGWSAILLLAAVTAYAQSPTPPPGQTRIAIAGEPGLDALIDRPLGGTADRCSLWIDAYTADRVDFHDMVDDLRKARVVYVGELHTLRRHHLIQEQILQAMVDAGDTLCVGLEMLESGMQPELDRYWRGETTFDTLAARIAWSKSWRNYEDYRGFLEIARAHGIPVLGLNARRDLVRKVGMQGLDSLRTEDRALLPAEIDFDQPMYKQQLVTVLQVHAKAMGMEKLIETMFQAQVVRDETMAESLVHFLAGDAGRGRKAIVLCGSQHCSHGLGIPSRVERRLPGIEQRIVVMSASNEVVLSEAEKKLSSGVSITHADLRHLRAPIADYLQVSENAPDPVVEPGTSQPGEGNR